MSTANSLAATSRASNTQITLLVTSINQALSAFLTESSRFASPSRIDKNLRSALYYAQAAAALAAADGSTSGIRNRLQKVAFYLGQAYSLMSPPTAATTLGESAHALSSLAVSSLLEPVIGPADTRSSASLAPSLTPGSLGTILGDATLSPLALQTTAAVQAANGSFPYELAGVSVTIGGKAAQVIAVSPSRVNFYLPPNLPAGPTELIVTSEDGYISYGTTVLSATAPAIFTLNGSGSGAGSVVNASTLAAGSFEITTEANFGADSRTRLMILATGISHGAANSDASNDIVTDSGRLVNVAESVAVEARLGDGRTLSLPVEFAGTRGAFPGLDQVHLRLTSELQHAGDIELTIIINNQRSNSVMVIIR